MPHDSLFPSAPANRPGVRCWLLLAGVLLSAGGQGQPVQWASRVISVSSERLTKEGGRQFRASQALGRPSVLPQVKDSPCAWAPASTDANIDEFIVVTMARPQPIRQVLVAESANPGAIVRVSVYDEKDGEHVIFSDAQATKRAASQPIDPLLRIMLPDSSLVGQRVKVVLNPGRTKGLNQLDAIGITSAAKPVVVGVNVSPGAPATAEKENLGKNINSTDQDMAPVISPDGKTLYLTRNNKANIGPNSQDVWYAALNPDRTWGKAKNMGGPVNNVGNNAINSISADGKTIYLLNVYQPDGPLKFGVSKSTLLPTGWSFPEECIITNNYTKQPPKDTPPEKNIATMEFTVSADEQTMVLALQRNETEGDRDLYVSFRQPDLTWSEPRSVGQTVNTADEEAAPFLAVDNRTLYFTSEGHAGFGNGDIFITRRLDDTWTNWTPPENLGPAINTAERDGYFSIPASGDVAYFSSQANSLGRDDIFRLTLYPAIQPDAVAIVSGQVLDVISRKPVPTEVIAALPSTEGAFSKVAYDPGTGEYKLVLPTRQTYQLTTRKDGYFPIAETLDLSRDKRHRDIRRNLYVMPIRPGAGVVLQHVLFNQSESDLLPGFEAGLDPLLGLMAQYPTMTILIEGHTDNQGERALNMALSEERVQRVKTYLTGKGVAPARIQTKGRGPDKPIAANDSEASRKRNRRVEFTILTL